MSPASMIYFLSALLILGAVNLGLLLSLRRQGSNTRARIDRLQRFFLHIHPQARAALLQPEDDEDEEGPYKQPWPPL